MTTSGQDGAVADSISNRNDGRVEHVESRLKVALLVAGSAVFTMVGGWWVWAGGPESGRGSGPYVLVIMALGAALGLLGLAVFVPRLVLRARVLLAVDDDGFDDRASFMPAGRVEWSEVTEIKLMRVSGRSNIAMRVSDPDKLDRGRGFLARRPDKLDRGRGFLARRMAAVNTRWADVWIPDSALPVPIAGVVDEMLRRWERVVEQRSD